MKLIYLSIIFILISFPANATQSTIEGPISGYVIKVIDGDTMAVRMNVWLDQQIEVNLRIMGIDTPEIHGKCKFEKEKAEKARQTLLELINNQKIKLYNIRHDKYTRRVLADIENANGINLAKYMIEKGLARPYKGDKRKGWCS